VKKDLELAEERRLGPHERTDGALRLAAIIE